MTDLERTRGGPGPGPSDTSSSDSSGRGQAGTRSAVLDEAHVGDIRGALGTIREDDHGPRRGCRRG